MSHVPGGKFIGNPEILQHFYVFRAYAFMELRLILKHENLIKNFAMWFDKGRSFSKQFYFYLLFVKFLKNCDQIVFFLY